MASTPEKEFLKTLKAAAHGAWRQAFRMDGVAAERAGKALAKALGSAVVMASPSTNTASENAVVFSGPKTNLFPYPSAEIDDTTPGNLRLWDQGGLTRSTTHALFGSYSWRIDDDINSQELLETHWIPVSPSTTYTLSCYVKDSVVSGRGITLGVKEHDTLGAVTATTSTVFNTPGVAGWHRAVHTFTTDFDAVKAEVFITGDGTGSGIVYIDGIQLETGPTASDYVDGSLGQGYVWAGEAHKSTSTYNTNNIVIGAPFAATAPTSAFRTDGVFVLRAGVGGGGVTFPAAPKLYDRVFRTDRGIEYFWNGTRWLSVQQFALNITAYNTLPGTQFTASSSAPMLATVPSAFGGTQIYLTDWVSSVFLGATNTDANYWNLGLSNQTNTNFTSWNTRPADHNPDLVAGWNLFKQTVASSAALRTLANDVHYRIHITMVGSPTAINFHPGTIHYRLVG